MQAALDITLPYVRERRQFDEAIGTFELMQAQGRRHVHRAAVRRARSPTRSRAITTPATGAASTRPRACCTPPTPRCRSRWKAIQSLGGNGYINEYPTGRLLRDAKLYAIGAGTNEIRRMLIGRELFAGNS